MRTFHRNLLTCCVVLAFCAASAAAPPAGTKPATTPPCAIPQGQTTATTDRVGFPADYAANLKLLGVKTQDKSPEFMTTYGNDLAASVTRDDQLPFPDGALLMMEFASAAKDAQGNYLRDAAGKLVKGELLRVDVMRRGPDFGVVYGEARAGQWEFASYSPTGETRIPPDKGGSCAACHQKVGAEKDFVHRIRVPGGESR